MYYTDKEREIIRPFSKYLSSNIFTKEKFLLVWKNGTKLLVTFDTTDTDDNGLEPEDPNYEEYASFIVRIKKLIKFNDLDGFKKFWLEDGVLFEFSYHDFPDEIYNSKGELISKKKSK